MKEHEMNRRDLMKTAAAGVAAGALGVWSTRNNRVAAASKPQVKIAGYAYDRVRAIQDGRLGLDRFNTSFHVEGIYGLNENLFGTSRRYEISETGLIPYVTKYANDNFPLEKGPPGVDESEMIVAGDVDALITAITPKVFLDGHPKVKRLCPDFRSAERAYYLKTRFSRSCM